MRMADKAIPTVEEDFLKNHRMTIEEYKKTLDKAKTPIIQEVKMYLVKYQDGPFTEVKFYNKKSNAVKFAMSLYKKETKKYAKENFNGNIEEAIAELNENGIYDDDIKSIKDGHSYNDWATIFEIDPED